MNHNMDFDLGLDQLLEPDSELIEALCEQLEEQGICLTPEILAEVLGSYEEVKFSYFKEFIEQVVGQQNLDFGDNQPAVIQVVMDKKSDAKRSKDELDDVDTKYLS